MAGKYYAVRCGRKPGIYYSWDICKKVVDGYPGAKYKSFKTKEEALAFVGDAMITENNSGKETKQAFSKEPEHYAFVDGSFNTATSVYGYGGFLVTNGQRHVVQGSGTDPEMAAMRNVAGEVLGSMAAMKLALELGLTELTIYYDYMGIEMWATKRWKRNNALTQQYAAFYDSIKNRVRVHFHKVAAHTGDTYNEMADALAKQGAGI